MQQKQDQSPFFKKDGEQSFFSDQQSEKSSKPFFSPSNVQTKLKVGVPNDKYEVEADRVADRVVKNLNSPAPKTQNAPAVQNKVVQNNSEQIQQKEGEEEEISMKEMEVQRKPIFESAGDPPEDTIQGKAEENGGFLMRSSNEETTTASNDIENSLASSGSGHSLPADTRASMESGIGADFSNVRVHTDSNAVQMNQQLGAQAFAHGSNIYFNEGKYDTNSSSGKHLLAHELTHTVQQGGVQMKRIQKEEIPSPAVAEAKPSYKQPVIFWTIDGFNGSVPKAVAFANETVTPEQMGHFFFINPDLAMSGFLLENGFEPNQQIYAGTPIIWPYKSNPKPTSWALKMNSTARLVFNGPASNPFSLIAQWGVSTAHEFAEKRKQIEDGLKVDLPMMKLFVSMGQENEFISLLKKYTEIKLTRYPDRYPIGGEYIDEIFSYLTREQKKFSKLFVEQTTNYYSIIFNHFSRVEEVRYIRDVYSHRFANDEGFAEVSFKKIFMEEVEDKLEKALGWVREKAAAIAKRIPGYTLLTVILGRDHIAGKDVEQSGRNYLHGAINLIPVLGEEMFQALDKAGKVDSIVDWFKEKLTMYNISGSRISEAAGNAWDSLSISDVKSPSTALRKIANAFQPLISDILSFGGEVLDKIKEVVVDGLVSLAGSAGQKFMSYVRGAGNILVNIIKDPIGFVKNLMSAAKQGLWAFAENIGDNLKAVLFDWLFGAFQKDGIELPTKFSVQGFMQLILNVLGFSWENFKEMLKARIGEKNVARLEKGVGVLKRISKLKSLAGAWKELMKFSKGLIEGLKQSLVDGVQTVLIKSGIQQLVKLLAGPAGGIIAAIETIVNLIKTFFQKLNEISEMIQLFFNSIADIAAGSVSTAAEFIKNGLVKMLTVVMNFLANQLGLGAVIGKIKEFIFRIRDKVNAGITKLIDWIIKKGSKFIRKGDKEVENVDPEMSAKISAGFFAIPEKEKKYLSNKKLSREEAELVAIEIKKEHPVFKVFKVVDGGDTWDYYYEANPKGKVESSSIGKEEGADLNESLKDFIPSTNVNYKSGHRSNKIPRRINQSLFFSSYDGKKVEAWINPKEPTIGNGARHLSAMKEEVAARSGVHIAGHLLNHHTDGDGLNSKNIAPITSKANAEMRDGVEKTLKGLKNPENDALIYFQVVVVYPSSPTPGPVIPAEGFLPKRLKFKVKELKFDLSLVSDDGQSFKEGIDFEKAKALKKDKTNWTDLKEHAIPDVVNDISQWINSPIGSAVANLNKPTDAVLRDAGISDKDLRNKIIAKIKGYQGYETMTKEEIAQALTSANIEWTADEIGKLSLANLNIYE